MSNISRVQWYIRSWKAVNFNLLYLFQPILTGLLSCDWSKLNRSFNFIGLKKCRVSKFPLHQHATVRRKAGRNLNGLGLSSSTPLRAFSASTGKHLICTISRLKKEYPECLGKRSQKFAAIETRCDTFGSPVCMWRKYWQCIYPWTE